MENQELSSVLLKFMNFTLEVRVILRDKKLSDEEKITQIKKVNSEFNKELNNLV